MSKKSNYQKFYDYISPHIKDVGQVPLIKECLIYQLLADKFNVFVCGDPGASAKSSYKQILDKVAPSFEYFSYSGHQTKVGLSQVIRRLREGLLHIDEVGKASGKDVDILRDVMQFQTLKVDKYQKHKNYDAKINVYATCNPKGNNDRWDEYGHVEVMKDQVPISSSIYRRFHVSIFTRDYDSEEFNEVNRHKVEHDSSKINAENFNWMQDKILELRKLEPKLSVPQKVYEWLQKLKYFDEEIVMPISPEIIEGVVEVAKANTRLREGKKVNEEDWARTLKFFHKCFKTGGLNNRLIEQKLGIKINND